MPQKGQYLNSGGKVALQFQHMGGPEGRGAEPSCHLEKSSTEALRPQFLQSILTAEGLERQTGRKKTRDTVSVCTRSQTALQRGHAAAAD